MKFHPALPLLTILLFGFCSNPCKAGSYYQPYPIQVTVNGSGSSMSLQCSVYDMGLGQWINHTTSSYSNISYQNQDGAVIFAEAGTYAYVEVISYDPLNHQFDTYSWTGYDNVSISSQDGVAAFAEAGTYATVEVATYDVSQSQWKTNSFVGYDNVVLTNKDGIVAFAEGGTYATIQCAIFDPEAHSWKSTSFTGYDNVTLSNTDGVVAFSESGTYATIYCATYDGGLQSWKTTSFTGYDNVTLINSNGVVAFAEAGTYATIYAATYDAWDQNWKSASYSGYDNVTLLNRNRIVAFAEAGNSATVGCFAYNVASSQWDQSSVNSSGVNSFAILSGTVTWLDNNSSGYSRGYTNGSGWGSGQTTLFPKFHVDNLNALSYNHLLQVRNYSTGADNVSYNFDDGSSSSQETTWHLYKINGHYRIQNPNYNVCLTATNASGSQTSCETVTFTSAGIPPIEPAISYELAEISPVLFQVSFAGNYPDEVQLVNSLGQTLLTRKNIRENVLLDMNAFAKGIYILRVLNEKSESVRKICLR